MAHLAHLTGLSFLYTVISTSALHDAEARYPPPRCHQGTREKALKTLKDWASLTFNNTIPLSKEKNVYWLYGSAGVGKSAIAQTLADHCAANQLLAASFFFWHRDSSRNSPRNIFTTIAFQLAFTVPELAHAINSAIIDKPHILSSAIEVQFKQLILDPCLQTLCDQPRSYLIIIDGLDECLNSHDQQRIISILADGIMKHALPFKILVASRPEPRIREAFQATEFQHVCHWTSLDDSLETYQEIYTFLRDRFQQISKDHATSMKHVPKPWPTNHQIQKLVQRASGQFIYAATVLKYLDDEHSVPSDRLDIVLGTSIVEDDDESPFSELDALIIPPDLINY